MQLISAADRDARVAFYAAHDIGWVARPKHSNESGGFKRAGRFKKASNMNYALKLSLRMEEIYLHSLPIKEYQIVDFFLPKLKDEVMKVSLVKSTWKTWRLGVF